MRKIIISLILISIVISSQAQRQYFKKHIFVRDSEKLNYQIMFPKDYQEGTTEKYPLVLFLHGAGERGSDNEIQLTYVDKIFGSDNFRNKYPAFILIPQCPLDKRWVEVDWNLNSHKIPEEISDPLRLTTALLIATINKYSIDSDRIYITGLSMGGFGTWDMIARFPDMFAAAIPICGGGDEKTAKDIANIAIWAFHGTLDKVVPVSRTRNMINAIKAEGGNPKYTEVQTKGHFVWNTAYNTIGLWDWFFNQHK